MAGIEIASRQLAIDQSPPGSWGALRAVFRRQVDGHLYARQYRSRSGLRNRKRTFSLYRPGRMEQIS